MTHAQRPPLFRRALLGLATVAAVLVALAAPAAASPAEGAILHADSANAVAGTYIVVFKDSAVDRAKVGDAVTALTARYGGKAVHTYRTALRGFSATMTETQAKRLAADSRIAYVEQDRTVKALGTQTNPPSWGLDRIDQRNLPLNSSYTYPNTASNVRAYIIDTGVRITHTTFGGRAVSGRDTVDNDNDANDCNGHGTHVAGTVGGSTYGVAKAVNITAVRVLNCAGSGTTAGVVAGIDWVTADHQAGAPAVANMSLGGGADAALDTAVANSISDGVTYAVAAGNEFAADACTKSPARVPTAITVGSTTITDARSDFSNVGTCLDLFAPGTDITSAWNTNDTATNTISGTSMATPHTAGAAALVLSANPSFTPQQVRDKLVADATSGAVTDPRAGSPNKLLFVGTGTPPVNDFSVSVSPTSGSVAPGGSATATVGTATTSGSAQAVTLSASGLPAGATASFSPASVTSGASSTLTLATTAAAAPGTYTVTVTGTGASATHTAAYTLTVTGGGGGCTSPGQKLGNPGFETATAPWTASAGVIGAWTGTQAPRTGTRNAWMNGYGRSHTDTVTQNVAVPAGCTTYTLSLWLNIKTTETTTTVAYDTFKVQVISAGVTTTLGTFSNLNKSAAYTQKSFNLSAFAGKTVTVKFLGVEDSSLQTSFLVDDTALTVS